MVYGISLQCFTCQGNVGVATFYVTPVMQQDQVGPNCVLHLLTS